MPQEDQFRNLVDLCQRSCARFADNPLFGSRGPGGQWSFTTYGQFAVLVDHARAGLASLGVGAGDQVAVIANNRLEWAVGAYATYSLGACYVPMYEKQNLADWEYIVGDSGAKVLIVANEEIRQKTLPFLDRLPILSSIVCLDADPSADDSWAALMVRGEAAPVPAADPALSDLAGYIYTSGTTGKPKGVMLTHGNFTSNVNSVQRLFPMEEGDRSLSFLPWAHSFGQTCEMHCGISFGISMAICDDVDRLIEYLAEVRPSLLFSVPRIFNRIYDGLQKKLADAPPMRRKLFALAMDNASLRRQLAEKGRTSMRVEIKHALFDRLVFSKVRERLGGQLRCAFSGGAAISREVAEFIDNLGVLVFEGYGLSETSPIATMNYPDHRRIGSVGLPIPGVEVLIDTDAVAGGEPHEGEILIRGPNVMLGYHNLEQETAKVMTEDGAFRTGDIGWRDDEGYVYISGRIKEQYKLENGKYVAPAPLEEQLKLSGMISQVLVYGDNKPHNVAVIVPDVPALENWASRNGLDADLRELLDHPAVETLFREELSRYSQDVFKGFERVKAFRLIVEEFTTDNEMLTPTLKLKRRNVIKQHQGLLDAMYVS